MAFEIVGEIEKIETIASGSGVKIRVHLLKAHGKGSLAQAQRCGNRPVAERQEMRRVERHWYEAHGIGRRDFKIKAYLT